MRSESSVFESVKVAVPRDPEIPIFEQIQLGLADPVVPLDSNDIPSWLIEALKRANPKHFVWANADELDGGDSEAAWTILQGYSFLDHEGLSEDGSMLVSEPYGLDDAQFSELMMFLTDADLKVNIKGISNHAPSRTMRIEISKA